MTMIGGNPPFRLFLQQLAVYCLCSIIMVVSASFSIADLEEKQSLVVHETAKRHLGTKSLFSAVGRAGVWRLLIPLLMVSGSRVYGALRNESPAVSGYAQLLVYAVVAIAMVVKQHLSPNPALAYMFRDSVGADLIFTLIIFAVFEMLSNYVTRIVQREYHGSYKDVVSVKVDVGIHGTLSDASVGVVYAVNTSESYFTVLMHWLNKTGLKVLNAVQFKSFENGLRVFADMDVVEKLLPSGKRRWGVHYVIGNLWDNDRRAVLSIIGHLKKTSNWESVTCTNVLAGNQLKHARWQEILSNFQFGDNDLNQIRALGVKMNLMEDSV
eukprot:GHVQ01042570.1.p1 GENE.GHVQ01042570.1~~GHVQ01042570.1.p1  ORF type:complete len:325 (-),score=23.25 GHVQ01042570.1:113-1087(-)